MNNFCFTKLCGVSELERKCFQVFKFLTVRTELERVRERECGEGRRKESLGLWAYYLYVYLYMYGMGGGSGVAPSFTFGCYTINVVRYIYVFVLFKSSKYSII